MTDTLTAPVASAVMDYAAIMALAETLEDGIHPSLTEEVYRALPFANCSLLKILHQQSPKHCRWEMLHPSESTEAKTFGNAFHCKVLRPDDFANEWRITESCRALTGKGNVCGNPGTRLKGGEWVCGTHGRGLPDQMDALSLETVAKLDAMAAAYRSHARCRHYLYEIDVLQQECVIIWTDPETGVRCKAKLDQWGMDEGRVVIPDLKSCPDASEEEFGWQIANYLYTMQAAMYSDGLSIVLGGELVENFQFLAIEKEPPYACCTWKLHQGDIALGRAQYRSAMAKWRTCHELNAWPGYKGGLCPLPRPYFTSESKKV